MHGVKENPEFVRSLIEFIGVDKLDFVALEYPQSLEKTLNNKLLSFKNLSKDNDIKMLIRDGRFSLWHLKLIKWLVKNKIQIVCMDPAIGDWNKRDKKMFEKIESRLRKIGDKKAVIVAGNLHTRNKPFLLDNKKYIPLGSYLKNAININLAYGSGSFFNVTRKNFIKTKETADPLAFYIPIAHSTR